MRDRKLKLAILLFMAGVGVYPALAAMTGVVASAEPTQRANRRGLATRNQTRDYSHFRHAVAAHQQQACDACHKFPSANWKAARKGDAAFPDVTDYPQHASCLPCHRAQFFSGAVPTICSNCHTDPSPRNSTRFPFPSLRALFDASPKGKDAVSEYRVYFPHDKHESLFGVAPAEHSDDTPRLLRAAYWQEKKAEAKKPEDKNAVCANCHQTYQPQGDADDEYLIKPPKDLPETAFWLKKGAYKTSPPGHQACFSCHSEDMSPAAKDCGVCHKLMPATYVAMQRQPHADFDPKLAAVMGISDRTDLDKWGRREAGKFRHEWFSHAELSCQDCHKVAAINTTDPKGPTVPVLSCGGTGSGCHVTPSAADGGALNLEAEQKKASPAFQCTKCHVQLGKQPVPASHLKAIAAMKDKK